LELEVSFSHEKAVSVAVIKNQTEGVLESENALSQLQVIKLPAGSPFDILHNLLHHSLGPYFRAFSKALAKKPEKDTRGVAAVGKTLGELELSLYNCKQNVQIEQVRLAYHPDILSAAAKVRCSASSTGPPVEINSPESASSAPRRVPR
jgi:dynein heavy chain 1